jgi:hypothetical protein
VTFCYLQLLLLNAMIGPKELHADNSICLGRSIFSIIAEKTLPQQAIPSVALLLETFTYRYGEVQNDYEIFHCPRQYYNRPRVSHEAWRHGLIKEMNCIIGNHPIEDVLHISGWIQVHYMLCGKFPSEFYHISMGMARASELVPGRIYPLLDGDNEKGTICVCPEGKAFVVLKMEKCEYEVLPVDRWQSYLYERDIQVAPLIFRDNATIVGDDNSFAVVMAQHVSLPSDLSIDSSMNIKIHNYVPCQNYLNFDGNYMILHYDENFTYVNWKTVHSILLPLGHHIAISANNISNYMVTEKSSTGSEYKKAKVPNSTCTHVIGYLRYADECDNFQNMCNTVVVAFRIKSYSNEFEDVCILSVPLGSCEHPESLYAEAQTVDYLVACG